jgi:hypothetical protein
MAPRKPLTVFLLEHYRPGHGVEQLRHGVRRIQVQMQETAAGASLLCSVVVPTDEAFLLVVAAKSEQAVWAAYTRAGTTFDRISTAIADLAVPEATGPRPGASAPAGSAPVAATTSSTTAPRTEPERNHLMRITKRALFTLAALLATSAIATSAALAATGGDHSRTSTPYGQQLNGTWTTTVQLTDAPPGAPASFNALDTFLPGGNLLVSSSAPNPALRTLAHGTWIRTGDHRFASTFVWFRFDPTGQYVGTQQVSRTMVLAKDGASFQASDIVEIVSPTGAVVATIHGTEAGTLLRG